ncbi:substrate-binding domain-containing protein [Clostridium aciditolerans]|uniref:Substrate-binding domain-containing protein n=1 Tax=Clostridium aciditolerans TaxID=339861 RepID=A0A934HNA9_9CLOT|nr:substrate-binding domain-containing protein [Clostridium aciditolerans]MBI6871401.1 substrate-binding domain-containing protein [Clostridium aciditolerans]
MKIIKRLVFICIAFVLIFCLVIYYPNLTFSGTQKNEKILVIGGMATGDYWGTVKMGAEAAAEECNVAFNYLAPKDESDIQGQINLIENALNKGISALVVAPNDYEKLSKVIEKAYSKRIPVIVMNSRVNTNKFDYYISADNIDGGRKAGDMLVSILGTKFKVGIMSSIEGADSLMEREKGLLDLFSQYKGVEVVAKGYCLSDPAATKELTKKMLSEHRNLDAIVALNSNAAEGVAETLNEMNLEGSIKVIAFDSTLREIDYLEKGIISATIIHDPFTMGYLSVKYAVNALNKNNLSNVKYAMDIFNKKDIPNEIKIKSKIIDGTNMYFQENEKFLFPIVK